jgi:hypothetical protein
MFISSEIIRVPSPEKGILAFVLSIEKLFSTEHLVIRITEI